MEYYVISPNVYNNGDNYSFKMYEKSIAAVGWEKDTQKGSQFKSIKKGDCIIVAKRSDWKWQYYYMGIVAEDENEPLIGKIAKKLSTVIDLNGYNLNFENWSANGSSQIPSPQRINKDKNANIINNIEKILNEYSTNPYNQEVSSMSKLSELTMLLKHTHNLILHGAPGTGKTHLAKEIAKEMGAEWEMVQFHPSYDYTDFVEGLRPVKTDDGNQVGFERKDGVFKAFCERALKNFLDSKKSVETLQEEKSIEEKMDEFIANAIDNKSEFEIATGNKFYIDRTTEKSIVVSIPANEKVNELSLSKSELTSLLSTDKKIENGNDVKEFFLRKWRTQQDSYTIVLYREIKKIKAVSQAQTVQKIEEKPFIFIIDEINRGEISKIFGELFFSIDPGYRGLDENGKPKGLIKTQYQNLIEAGDAFADGFFVPENVYIIGTMNDIDRSVESMDFAFRRRFTFCEIKAADTLDMLDGLDDAIRDEARKRLLSLNDAISAIEGLSSAYHIGGAYFLKLKELENDFAALWSYHLEGLLREYLRGMEGVAGLLADLKAAYDMSQPATQAATAPQAQTAPSAAAQEF